MRTKRPQHAREEKHNWLSFLTPLKFFGVFIRPVVVLSLCIVIKMTADKDHLAPRTLDNLPLCAREERLAFRAAA